MKGFTLIEVIVALSIFTLMILAIFGMMDMGRSSWFTGNLAVEIRQEIIKPFMTMEKELRETASSQMNLANGSNSGSITFRMPQDNDGDGDVLDALGNIEWSGDVTYALNANSQITRTVSGAVSVLANNIVSLRFTRPVTPVDILQIDITSRKTSALGRQMQETGQIKIKMRNL
jgi:prepilin-type N-terminal cleavage/methylation domain-containing protein